MSDRHAEAASGSTQRLRPRSWSLRLCIVAGLIAACAAVSAALGAVPAAAAPALGDVASFWAIDWARDQGVSGHPVQTVDGVVAYVGAHVVVYVQQGRTIPEVVATGLGEAFDLHVYPSLTAALGPAPDPGIDGEPRVAILVYDFGDGAVTGYFNRNDIDVSVPLGVGATGGSGTPAFSNHREMVSINLAALLGQSDEAADSAAHEFAHLLTQYHGYVQGPAGSRVPQKAWVEEGIATYAEALAGYAPKTALPLASFGADPNKNVTIWGGYSSDYGASCALIGYFTQRAQPGFLQALVRASAEGKTGVAALQDALDDSGTFEPFGDLFDDWVAANFLTGRPAAAAPYAYEVLALEVRPEVVGAPLPAAGQGDGPELRRGVHRPPVDVEGFDGAGGRRRRRRRLPSRGAPQLGLRRTSFPDRDAADTVGGLSRWQGDVACRVRPAHARRLGARIRGGRGRRRLSL